MGLEFTYSAYWDLNTCREYGFSAGPIPWSAIRDYAVAHDLDNDEYEEFSYLIRAMDVANMKWNAAQKEDKTAKPPK